MAMLHGTRSSALSMALDLSHATHPTTCVHSPMQATMKDSMSRKRTEHVPDVAAGACATLWFSMLEDVGMEVGYGAPSAV